MKRDTVLREDSKVGIGGIVKESSCQQPARGRDESGRGTKCLFRWDESSMKDTGGWARDVRGGIGMDIDVVQIGGDAVKEAIPERSEM